MSKAKVVVIIEGGVINEILASEDLDVIVLDYDTEGGDEERIKHSAILGDSMYVTDGPVVVDAVTVDGLVDEARRS